MIFLMTQLTKLMVLNFLNKIVTSKIKKINAKYNK